MKSRKQKYFPPDSYHAQFIGITTPKNGRVRLRFLVLNDSAQDWEMIATNQDFPEGCDFEKDFVSTFGTTPLGLRNAGFLVKLGTNHWQGEDYSTVLCYQPHSFVLPEWFRQKQEEWQSIGGAKSAYLQSRAATDKKFATAADIRRATWKSHKYGVDVADLLGCDSATLRAHLEAQFDEGMHWGNFARVWEVDHIKPLSSFDLTDPEQVKKAAHYSNLRPLAVEANRAKYNALAA